MSRLPDPGATVRLLRNHCPRSSGFGVRDAPKYEVGEKERHIRTNQPDSRLILGIDRLDHTKGIPNRMEAFVNALKRYPDLRGKVSLAQVVVPSREGIQEYDRLKQEIERMVGEINGQFTEVGWTSISYIFRSLNRTELAAYYRACHIALVTPLKDGMNLIAKEYCASCTDGDGVLILSEFAGAAAQLQQGALLVNPYDIEGVAIAIHQAFLMAPAERQSRMRILRRNIRKQDIFHWVNSFLRAGIEKDLSSFPHMEPFLPTPKHEGKETGVSAGN